MKRPWLLLLVGLVLIVSAFIWMRKGEGRIEYFFETAEQIQKRKDADFVERLKEVVSNETGKYAVMVSRLETGISYGFNEREIMPARSVIKVPIILAVSDLNLVSKLESMVERMGKYSDNSAQIKVEKEIGKEAIVNTINKLGMISTNFDKNITCAEDLVMMWRAMYQKYDLEKYLTDSIYEDRIAKGIPKGTKLVHKVGTDVDVWNDSGIVIPQCAVDSGPCAKPFVLVILNEGIKREEAEKIVPAISKMIFDHETSL